MQEHLEQLHQIRDNVQIVAKSMQEKLDTNIVAADATKWHPTSDTPYDLIFVDPPYEQIEQLSPKLFPLFECTGRFEPKAEGWTLNKRLGKGIDQPTACLLRRA